MSCVNSTRKYDKQLSELIKLTITTQILYYTTHCLHITENTHLQSSFPSIMQRH
jgi:hypothetical protein